MITNSPIAEVISPIMKGESDGAFSPKVQPESPDTVPSMVSKGLLVLQLEPEPEQELYEGPWLGPLPP